MQWHTNKNLSQRDLETLYNTKIYLDMLRQRVVVDFEKKEIPDFQKFGLSNARDLFYIKELGHKVYEFWFLDARDMHDFDQVLIEYKLTGQEQSFNEDNVPF